MTNWKGSEAGKQKIIYDLKEVSTATRSDMILSGNQTHQFVTHSDVSRSCFVSIIRELIALLAFFRIVVNGMFFSWKTLLLPYFSVLPKVGSSLKTSPIKVVARILLKNVTPLIKKISGHQCSHYTNVYTDPQEAHFGNQCPRIVSPEE